MFLLEYVYCIDIVEILVHKTVEVEQNGLKLFLTSRHASSYTGVLDYTVICCLIWAADDTCNTVFNVLCTFLQFVILRICLSRPTDSLGELGVVS